MMKHWKYSLGLALASATLLLGACGQSGEQAAQQHNAPVETTPAQAETHVEKASPAQPEATTQAKAAVEKVEQAVQRVSETAPGSGGAKAAPEQLKPPADKGAEIYGQCVGCHGPAGGGGVGPRLAGQSAADLIAKLKAYRAGETQGPQTAMMAPIAQGLSDADIEAVANYIAKNFK